MKQGLIQEQTMQRKINQSLIQSLQMLQFTSIELYDYINEIAQENPLIDEVIYDFDMQPKKYISSETISFYDINPAEKNLYEQLKDQLRSFNIVEGLKEIIEYGIDSLNEAGYLDIALEEWARNCHTTVDVTKLALERIQQLEPTGIGARNLGECILLQIRQMEGYASYMEKFLLQHLQWIADYNYEKIMESYSIDEEEVSKLIKLVQSCNPKPGHILEVSGFEYIMPEANIYKEDSLWKITFYKWSTPKIVYSKVYQDMNDKEAKNFLRIKTQQVEWLRRTILYRTATIELVIKKVVEKQQAFFEKGLHHLMPLTLSEIANELNLHVSTISRTISNKYIQTPHGIFAIKFFFQTGLKQQSGIAATIVFKKYIRDMIDREDKENPLSDEKITGKLQMDYSLNIARRTVMKYRQQLKIQSSIKRKKVK